MWERIDGCRCNFLAYYFKQKNDYFKIFPISDQSVYKAYSIKNSD